MRLSLVALCVVIAAAAVAIVVTRASQGSTTPTTRPAQSWTTRLGSYGVEASWVVTENEKQGTSAWRIPASMNPDGIEGFADQNDVTQGTTVGLYVTTQAPRFHVVAYRMGWYHGLGARAVWTSATIAGRVQPACTLTSGINMVSCDDWSKSLTVPITAAFVQGDYLFELIGSGGQESYVPLTVWDPGSDATYLIVNRTFTEEGWNAFGGYSFYVGEGGCAPDVPTYPICNRARVVSFDRPYDTGNGSSDFLGDEYPLVRFCEEHGLDVTYVTDVTLTQHPSIAMAHKAILSLGHDESWSYQERVGVQDAQARGVNVVFFGAASVLRHVRLQASPLGPDREEVDYRDSAEDPLDATGPAMEVTGNTWSSPPSSWSEIPFVGEEYSGYLFPGLAAPFVVADATAPIYKGTGLHDGSSLPNVIRSDIDHVDPGAGPPDLMVLGHSPIPLASVYTNQGQWGDVTYSDMTYYTDPDGGAGVLDTGTNNWINAMRPCDPGVACAQDSLDRITGNILWLFGQGPAARLWPARSNLATIRPSGS